MSRIKEIKRQILKLQKERKSIQAECAHPSAAVEKEHRSNTGNYDPSADCYWTNLHCTLCEKRWLVDGSI